MATAVPYSGTLSVAPQLDPLQNVHVNTPVEAFGGATAGAITHLGQVAEGAGKEVFARGLAMQELDQQDKANSAIAAYQNELTNSFVEYTKNQGQDALQKFGPFSDSTEELRQKYAEQMDSPYGKFLFNQESRQARWRTVFGAGNYAREQQKVFSKQSFDMRIDAVGDHAAATMPGDQTSLDQAIDQAKQLAGQKASESSFVPGTPDYDQAVRMGASSVVSKNVRQLMKSQPI